MNYLSVAIISIVALIVLKLLYADFKRQPDTREEGTIVLRMGNLYKIIGYSGIGASVILAFLSGKSGDGLISIAFIILFFAILGIPLILLSNVKIEIDDDKIKYYGMTGKIEVIRWEEITKVKFSFTSFVIMTDSTRVKFDVRIVGFRLFIEAMKEKVDYEVYRNVIPVLERIRY